MVDYSQLNFGAPAAERDIGQGLADYFVESPAFTRVANREKTVVLGNRGTGKSAIFKVLARREREKGSIVIELSPEDYSYEMLARVLVSESEGSWGKVGAYAASWRYLIWVLIMKGLSDKSSVIRKGTAARQLRRYLYENHPSITANPIGTLISYLKRIEGVKVGVWGAEMRTRELQQLYELKELQPLLPVVKDMCARQKVVVLVDELDRGWDASEDARGFVAGLFQACMSINGSTPQITAYISLRQELYDNIPELYDDVQKFRDVIEMLSWDELSLLRLAEARISYSLGLKDVAEGVLWNRVFAETLDGVQTKSLRYVADRTHHRPREMIEFCSQCREVAEAKSLRGRIDYSTIRQAEDLYSAERAKDIAAEYRFRFPGLMGVFEAFRGQSATIERDDMELLCLGISLGDVQIDAAAESWAIDVDPSRIIEILWEVGFLRAYVAVGRESQHPGGSQYVSSHQVKNINLRNVARFQIHPMFRAYLGSYEAEGHG
jgi:energy-coupling factor transporter ATP-binding protein EcfA2